MDTLSCQFIVDREEKLEAKSSLRLEAVLQNGRRRPLNLTVVKGGPSDGELSMPPTITLDQGKGFQLICSQSGAKRPRGRDCRSCKSQPAAVIGTLVEFGESFAANGEGIWRSQNEEVNLEVLTLRENSPGRWRMRLGLNSEA
jgi:hypothetical protein